MDARSAASSRKRLTVGIVVNVTVIAFEALAVAAIAPKTAHDLGGVDLYGWVFSAFMLAQLVSVVVGGHASDRYGPAPVLACGYVLFIAGLLLCGLAPTMPVLVLGRALQGAGAGALFMTAYVAIGRAYTESERPRQFALLSTAWVIPGLLAPALGGVIAEQVGWRWVFLGMIVLPLAAACLALPALAQLPPLPTEDQEGTLPVGAALVLATGVGLLIAGLGTDDLVVSVPLLVLGVVPAVWAFRQLTPVGTLRARPGLPAAVATRGLLTFAFFGSDAFFALGLASVRGLSALEIGLALTPQTMTWTIGSWLQARRAGQWTRRGMAVGGSLLLAGAIVGVSTALVADIPLFVPIVAWAVSGIGMGLAYSQTSLVGLSEASDGRQGASAAAIQMSDVLGIALGTGVGGAVVALAASTALTRADAIAIVFTITLSASLLSVVTARRLPSDPAVPSHGLADEVVPSPVHGHDLS